MKHALALLVLSFALNAGCLKKDPLFCDEQTPCTDPARPFCDLTGEFPASEGIGKTCIPSPFGPDAGTNDAAVADAGGCDSFIAFSTFDGEVYTIRPDGTDLRHVSWFSTDPMRAIHAGPNGRYVLFLHEPAGGREVMLHDTSTGDSQPFATGSNVFPHGFTSDGADVLFTDTDPGDFDTKRLWRRPVGGGTPLLISQSDVVTYGFATASAESVVAYESSLSVRFINLDGTNDRLFRDGASTPVWSIDGGEVAYVEGGEVYRSSASGAAPENVSGSPASDTQPTFSTLGEVAWTTNRNGPSEVYWTVADGIERHPSTNTTQHPEWSADGTELAAMRVYTALERELIVVRTADHSERALPLGDLILQEHSWSGCK